MSDVDARTVEIEPVVPPIDEVVDAETRKTLIILKKPKLAVTSFLGRPAEGGDLAKEVRLADRGQKVVLVWKTIGAEQVTLVRKGRDGKRVVVQEDLDFEGELETDVTDFETTFTLEASARDQLELEDVEVIAGSALKIESFLGRPAEGGELAKELTVAPNGRVVLVWKVAGATDVTLAKRGKDGKRTIVARGLELEGELETVADQADLTFTLEASDDPTNIALEDVRVRTKGPIPPPRPTSPRVSLTGRPVNAGAPKDPRRFSVDHRREVELTWSAANADTVVLLETINGRLTRTPLSGSGGTLLRTPARPEDAWTIEATGAGGETARDTVQVTVVVPETPQIVAFTMDEPPGLDDGSKRLDPRLKFDWRVSGPVAKVKLLPYGDVTAETVDGVGQQRLQPAGGPEVQEYTLEVFDAAGQRTDFRTVERRIRIVPKVDTTATFGGFVPERGGRTPVERIADVTGTESVILVVDVTGPFRKVRIRPLDPENKELKARLAVLNVPPGERLRVEVHVNPNKKDEQPDPLGNYTLMVDDTVSKSVNVKLLDNPLFKSTIEIKLEEEQEIIPKKEDAESWFKFELKGILGFKCKLVPGPNETEDQIKVTIGAKKELKLDMAREFKFKKDATDSKAPDWVIEHVDKIKESKGPKMSLSKGKLEADVSIAWEVTFRKQKIRGVEVTPKAQIEIVGIKLAQDKKKGWIFEGPGTLKFKSTWEFPVTSIEMRKYGFPWDMKDIVWYFGFAPSVSPNEKKIIKELGSQLRNALSRIGMDAAATVAFAVVMAVLVIALIVFVAAVLLSLSAFRASRQQWSLACRLHRRLMGGAPTGLADAAVDLLPPVQDPQDLPPVKDPDDVPGMQRQGEALGRSCRQHLRESYRRQPEMVAALDGMMEGLQEEIPDPNARRRKVEEQFIELFRQKMIDTMDVVKGNFSHHLFYQLRKSIHVQLCERMAADGVIRDRSFRELFIGAHANDEPEEGTPERAQGPDPRYARVGRQTEDYDLPEVDDELFERAMTDQWFSSAAVASAERKRLEQEWAKLGYDGKDARPPRTDPSTQFNPEVHKIAITRDMRREKRKRKTPLMKLFEVRDGAVREDSGALSSTRDALLSELPDRGLIVRGIRQDLLTILTEESWTSPKVCDMVLGGWGALGKKGQERITMPVVSGARDLDRAAVAIWSSDHGFEFIVADVVPPAHLRLHPNAPPSPVLVEVTP